MCGIAGHVVREGTADAQVVSRQLSTMCHRGPDSDGVFAGGSGAIGQTRLAVIDLVSGDPPIATPDGSIGVVLNGEIYGYAALRAELLQDGHELHTTGDTEVLAHLAETHEPEALATRLDGMFAFAVWDTGRQRLVLGRDRLGKKPLYYYAGPEAFVFASEIKGLLEHPAVPRTLDPAAVPAYLTFGYVPTPGTFYEGVRSLRPGHVLVVEGDAPPEEHCYWRPSVPGLDGTTRLRLGLREAADELRPRLAQAVRRRLVADVPVGAFLSGGIDSSAVVAMMAQESSRPVQTFTIGFEDDEGFDERPFARQMAEAVGAEHTEFVVAPDAVDLVDRLVWHHDQPFGDSSAVPTYLLSELTSKHVTVALCGDGGDELFAGYERFAAGRAAEAMGHMPTAARRTLVRVARAGGKQAAKVARFARAADAPMPEPYLEWVSYVRRDEVRRLLPQLAWPTPAVQDYARAWAATAGAGTLDRLLLLNIQTYLLDDLLVKVDRTSMAHSLEVRAPFLDHELVEWALRLPPHVKARGLSLKRCLKAAVQDMLPPGLLDRPKRGFGVPLDRWFRQDLSSYVTATLGSRTARLRRHVDGAALDAVLAEHASGARDHGHALWTLLTLELFLQAQGW